MRAAGPAELGDGRVQLHPIVFDLGGRQQHLAVKVAEHPLGAGLGTIDTDDAEVLRAHLLHPRMKTTARFLQVLWAPGPTPTATIREHSKPPPQRELGKPHPPGGSLAC